MRVDVQPVGAGVHHRLRQLGRNLHADFFLFLGRGRCRELVEDLGRPIQPGQLAHSLHPSAARHRHDPGDERNTHTCQPGALGKADVILRVEEKLGDGEVCAEALLGQKDVDVLVGVADSAWPLG